jgi:electron transport complex protein RnfC
MFSTLKTFPKGGIHPPENKLTEGKPIIDLPMPRKVFVPLSQHIGIPSEVIVERRAKVKTGEIIAKAGGYVSSNIHSPVTGVVAKIDMIYDSSGYKRQAIVINPKEDDWLEGIITDPGIISDISIPDGEIINKITEAGIVGMGGAAFPSHVKLNVKEGVRIDTLIINGVECEPYLTADHALMLEKAEELMIGIELLRRNLKVDRAMIGIENNKKDAIKLLKEKSKNYPAIDIYALQVKYPQGSEKQLIKALSGKEVPIGGLPMDVGVIVHNVGTVYAVYQAVQKNRPLIDRIVTVTGKHLTNPGNFRVRIGTPVSALIEAAGGMPEDTGKIIGGGPMMGRTLMNPEVPVTKGTSGILLLSQEDAHRQKSKPCIRCGKCVFGCPMGLEPYLLLNLSSKALFDKANENDALNCIECGSCNYVCPSHRPLLDYIRLAKSVIRKNAQNKN